MSALYHDSGIPAWLSPTPLQFDWFEQRIAEQIEEKKTVVSLSYGWWLYPQVNVISDRYQNRLRVGTTSHDWHLFLRDSWYWRNQKIWQI